MRYLKLGVIGAILVIVSISALRIAAVITADQAQWLRWRALAAVVLLTVASAGMSIVASRSASQAPDRPIP
jgi:hypothetical protein